MYINYSDELTKFISINYFKMNIKGSDNKKFKKCISKSTENPFYQGLLPRTVFVDAILMKIKGINYEDMDFSIYPFSLQRKKIHPNIRLLVWEKDIKTLLKDNVIYVILKKLALQILYVVI